MKKKFLAWLSVLRWRLVRKLGGEMPGDRALVARSISPGLCRVEVNYRFMVCKMADLLDERHAGIVREAVWHRLVREMDAAGLLQYELYRTGENTVTVVCGLRGLTVTTSEKREAWIQSGMSSSVLGQVSEKWNGLADERRGGSETPADVGERDREQLSDGTRPKAADRNFGGAERGDTSRDPRGVGGDWGAGTETQEARRRTTTQL